jgi:subtilisin family serine protease
VLTLTPDEAYIEFITDLPQKEKKAFIKENKLELVREDTGVLPRPDFHEAFPDQRWVRLPGGMQVEVFIERVLGDKRVRVATPVYHRADLLPVKTGITFTDHLLVNFKTDVSSKEIFSLIRELGTEDVSGKPNLLGDTLRRVRIKESKKRNTLEIAEEFMKSGLVKSAGPDWAQLNSIYQATTPNDTYWMNQWNMTRIGAPDGWDLTQGVNTVVIAIIDSGCDLNHEDLQNKYVPVADRWDAVAGTNTPDDQYGHGTCCAGIAAAETNTATARGVAGVAWNCRIMPISIYGLAYESQMVSALNWARTHGAHVISMSIKLSGPHANVDTAITAAHTSGIVLVAASGNDEPTVPPNEIGYPASHPLVMAVGASDQADHRCVWTPGVEASQFGPDLDVVAPGIATWTTDRSGSGAGYNNNLAAHTPPYGDSAGHYFSQFGGTSGATPHVAGLAALLRSLYPALTNDQVRSIIGKTAEKVGGYAYDEDPAHPLGTWNNEMGYGRINVFRALDFADVCIKDHPSDDGTVPFTAGNFWDESDIVVRKTDDNTFSYQKAERGQTNYIYVRVTNLGPATARNVRVSVRAVPYPGTEFVYPGDWTAVDATHILPTDIHPSLGNLAAGATGIAKFSLIAAQVDQLYGWELALYHPCLLAEVQCDNDYGTPVGFHTWLNNNLAQRNISTEEIWSGAAITYPFVAGNKFNADRYMEIVVERPKLPREAELLLGISEANLYFPVVEPVRAGKKTAITFLDKTRLSMALCGCSGVLTLGAGSSFDCGSPLDDDISLEGAEFVEREGRRLIAIRENRAVIGMQKMPGETRIMSLVFRVPEGAKKGSSYRIRVMERNRKQEIVGGVTFRAEVKR